MFNKLLFIICTVQFFKMSFNMYEINIYLTCWNLFLFWILQLISCIKTKPSYNENTSVLNNFFEWLIKVECYKFRFVKILTGLTLFNIYIHLTTEKRQKNRCIIKMDSTLKIITITIFLSIQLTIIYFLITIIVKIITNKNNSPWVIYKFNNLNNNIIFN